MKINKKFLQFVAAFLILIFHLWFPVTSSGVEYFIIKTGYVGVDIFFFLSAYSLADKQISYLDFVKNRFMTIYGKFLFFVIMAVLCKVLTIKKSVEVLTLIDFFKRGGGSFLWFVPSILMFYLIYPFFVKWKFKYKTLVALLIWFVAGLFLEYVAGYSKLFIFLNRIPVIIAGYVYKDSKVKCNLAVNIIFLIVGIGLLWTFGFKRKLNVPFSDFYFVFCTVFTVSVCRLSGYVKESRIWNILSMGTLEMYALQMIFGAKVLFFIKRIVADALLTNIITVAITFTFSIGFAAAFSFLGEKTKRIICD